MCGIWHGRRYHCWQMTPQENCPKHRLHRWSIAAVSVLVLLSFPFTWSGITTENLNSHALQDFSSSVTAHLEHLEVVMPLLPLWQPNLDSSPPSCTEKIWEFWNPGAPSCLEWSWYSNHYIKTRILAAPAHPNCPEMMNLLTVPPLTSHLESGFHKDLP